MQLVRARLFFNVPNYQFLSNRKATLNPAVVKSLSNELIDDKVLYTTRVSAKQLAHGFPWFIENEVEALKDITVAFVRGQIFSFSLKRDFLETSPDWRRFIAPGQQWCRHPLPASMESLVGLYMNSLQFDYGRLDLLLDRHGQYWFCEVNPNGQFAWLDLHDAEGLLSAIVNEISPATRKWPLSNLHPLDRERERETGACRS